MTEREYVRTVLEKAVKEESALDEEARAWMNASHKDALRDELRAWRIKARKSSLRFWNKHKL